VILFPYTVWHVLLAEFGRKRQKVEQIAFLDGVQVGDDSVITTLTFPHATLRRGNFHVSADAMSEAGKHLGSFVRIAQIHTHPGAWIGHSDIDDEFAYSRHDGALSLVVPNYSVGVTGFSDVAVHVCLRGRWRELGPKERDATIRLVPAIFDFRK
jgi:hypothetical protein